MILAQAIFHETDLNPMIHAGEKKATDTSDGPEVVIGLIGPLGVDLGMLTSELTAAFSSVKYTTRVINVIEGVLQYEPWERTPSSPYCEKYNARMDAGNEFRERLNRKDALGCVAITAIQTERMKYHDTKDGSQTLPIPRCSYILRSLKTPEEIAVLRWTYGTNFVAVAAYMPRALRIQALMRRIADSLGDPEI